MEKIKAQTLYVLCIFRGKEIMSIQEVESAIPIDGIQLLFSHSSFIRPQMELLNDAFERNERFKEFEGLIRANHRVSFINLLLEYKLFVNSRFTKHWKPKLAQKKNPPK
jgi:hypothetical protein